MFLVKQIFNLITAFGITMGLMFLTFRFIGTRYNKINDKKYIKVIDRLQVTKENSILIVKIGKKAYIMNSSAGHLETVSELSQEEINEIEEKKKMDIEHMNESYNNSIKVVRKISSKIINNIRSKEDRNEE